MAPSNRPPQRFWITSKIGWLSLCIIAAAWGNRLLPEDWDYLWGCFGLFGLTAALGLAVAKNRRMTFVPEPHDDAEAEKQPVLGAR
jgi:hypothetical protein